MVAPLLFRGRSSWKGKGALKPPADEYIPWKKSASAYNNASGHGSVGSVHLKGLGSYYDPDGSSDGSRQSRETMVPIELDQEITAITEMLKQVLVILHQEKKEHDGEDPKRTEAKTSRRLQSLSLGRYVSGIRRRLARVSAQWTEKPALGVHTCSGANAVEGQRELECDGESKATAETDAREHRDGEHEDAIPLPDIHEMEVPFRRAELANTSKPQRLCTEAARVSADPLLFPENVAFGPDYGQEQPEHWRLPPIAELPGDYGISTTDSKIFELGDNGKEGAESDREPWSANSWSDVAASHDGDPMSQFRPEELERWAAGGYEVPGASLERRLSFIRDQPDEITVRRIHPARPYSSPEGPESCAPGWDVVPGLGLQSEPSYTSGLRDSITVRGVASPASNSMAGKLKRRILNGEAIHGSLPAFDSAALEPPLIGISPSALEYEPNPVIFAHLRSAPPSEVVRLAGDNVQVSPLSDTEGVPTSEGVVSSGISSSSSTRLPGDPDTEGLGHTVIQENSTPYRRNKESPPGLDIKADPKQQSTQPFPIPGHDWSSHSDGFVCPYCQRPFRTAGLKK